MAPDIVKKVMPTNLIFHCVQSRSRVQIRLYEDVIYRLEGYIIGFDEYMSIVVDEAEELHMKTLNRKNLGRILLKGDNITLLTTI